MKIGDAATYLGISVPMVRRYADAGRLKCTKTPGGQRIFRKEDLDELLGRTPEPVTRVEAHYVRVSGTTGQESSLSNQEELLSQTANGTIYRVYRDKASGLNENRPGLKKLFQDAALGRSTVVRVMHEDRLARYGVEFIRELLAVHGVTIESVMDKADKSLQEELLGDFMAIVASFSGRFYQLRSREAKRKLLKLASDHIDD